MKKMKYSIDSDRSIIFCKYSGHIKAETLIAHIVSIRNDPDFHNGLNTISDIRKATFSESFSEIYMIADFIKSSSDNRDNFKLALIVEQSNQNSAKFYEILSMNNHAKMCYDLNDAEAWVCSDEQIT